jgi:hypothetical protein
VQDDMALAIDVLPAREGDRPATRLPLSAIDQPRSWRVS